MDQCEKVYIFVFRQEGVNIDGTFSYLMLATDFLCKVRIFSSDQVSESITPCNLVYYVNSAEHFLLLIRSEKKLDRL